ncbi:MAG: alpha/beta hydrolase [Cellulosilyticaceae bacterium]
MIKQKIMIGHIPAILWGDESQDLFVAVHGNMSSKEDTVIALLAEEVVPMGYQVLSFDLPEHGERQMESTLCKVETCIKELQQVMAFANERATDISVFGCSMGAYFSLLAYGEVDLKKSLFLSPVVNMLGIIEGMMANCGITEIMLEEQQEIDTPMGMKLYWDYYSYVKAHPITKWDVPTAILYGSKDELCAYEDVQAFAHRAQGRLQIVEDAAHYFHTPEELDVYRKWLQKGMI